jgi:hypothetical protein
MIDVFVGFSRILLLGILIFKGLTERRLYKSFGVKGLTPTNAHLTHTNILLSCCYMYRCHLRYLQGVSY